MLQIDPPCLLSPQTSGEPELTDVATHDEVMRILTAQARDGSVTAACALERALRAAPIEDEDFDAELERLAGRLNEPE
jgi:hypothetical protein